MLSKSKQSPNHKFEKELHSALIRPKNKGGLDKSRIYKEDISV